MLLALVIGCESEPAAGPVEQEGADQGPISTPLGAYQSAKQHVFQMQIQDALRVYKASDPYGKGPASHEEFMEKIIQRDGLQLPKLPPGQRYRFDPVKEELKVEPVNSSEQQ
jgi:hypothetical protein